jgi:hypothetical protein
MRKRKEQGDRRQLHYRRVLLPPPDLLKLFAKVHDQGTCGREIKKGRSHKAPPVWVGGPGDKRTATFIGLTQLRLNPSMASSNSDARNHISRLPFLRGRIKPCAIQLDIVRDETWQCAAADGIPFNHPVPVCSVFCMT